MTLRIQREYDFKLSSKRISRGRCRASGWEVGLGLPMQPARRLWDRLVMQN
jgi:hypothetical protein